MAKRPPISWDERYRAPGYVYGTEPNDFLVEVGDRIPPGRVLSLCEGEGRNGVWLAEQGYEVTAVDSSAVGLDKARALAAERGVDITTRLCEVASFQIAPDHWEGIISFFCHLPSEQRRVVHREVTTGLRPGGIFVLEAFTPAQLERDTGGPRDPDRLVSLADLKKELTGLVFIHGVERERPVREGSLHSGKACVVQLLARKPDDGRMS